MNPPERTRSRIARALVALALGVATCAAVPAAERDDPPSAARERLDNIREDLVQMRFDEALGAIEALLSRPALTEDERGEALVLRAQAHAAFGDFDAAERGYAEILRLRPGYAPDPTLTPEKALQRFEKVRARTVGQVEISIDPADATVRVDGREIALDRPGGVWLLAGTRTIVAERRGHDAVEQTLEVAAGKSTSVTLELVPNARTIVVRTVPAGVRVAIDGKPVGTTSSVSASIGSGAEPAELVVEDVGLGEHVYELSKECFRSERLTDNLAVDLLDRAPKRYQTVRLLAVSTPLALRGGPATAEARVDGKTLGRLPAESFEACPGTREISVAYRGRVLWMEPAELQASVEAAFEVAPRPNAALVGARDWPVELAEFGAEFNTTARLDRPARSDLGDPRAWAKLGLPEHIDLALAVVPGERTGAADRWYLYSPILLGVTPITAAPPVERPRFSTTSWGFAVVDSAIGGVARIVSVRPAGPAAEAGLSPGARVLEIGGRAVSSARDVAATLAAARSDRPIRIKWRTLADDVREAELSGRSSPLLLAAARERPVEATVRAAWAVVDALAVPQEAPSATANLGILLSEFGHTELAADAWRRVDWGARAGVGEGTKQYYLGRLLELSGREEEAATAYRQAARSAATAFTDDGPPIALAARDRLADLGVSSDAGPASARPSTTGTVSAR